MTSTYDAMAAGSMAYKYVVAIEGCKYLLCESHSAAALTAWSAASGGDWSSALEGLFVQIQNKQSVEPWSPFPKGGTCTIRVAPDTADTFGVFVNKNVTSAESALTTAVDRNDTTIAVRSTTNFTSSGEIHIGTECIAYTAKTSTTFTTCTRGKYSPFECSIDDAGSGGVRFGNPHRIATDATHMQACPVVSQTPRVWIGRRVGVWKHTWDAATEAMNTRAQAQLVFAGKIVQVADDPNTFHTVIQLEHVLDEVRESVIGRDLWAADIPEGLFIPTGWVFQFHDSKLVAGVGTTNNADDLVVVTSGASGTNEMNSGIYTLSELCEKLSAWLAAETRAARIFGTYNWQSPVSSSEGLRTKCYWRIPHATDVKCGWGLVFPSVVACFLGVADGELGTFGQTVTFAAGSDPDRYTNQSYIRQGYQVPYKTIIFKPDGPSRLGAAFDDGITYDVINRRGTFYDNYLRLPAMVKDSCDSSAEWGVFLLDEKSLIAGSYDSSGVQLINCWTVPILIGSSDDTTALHYIGRRADEPESGHVTVRQIVLLEGAFRSIFGLLSFSSGTDGYNQPNYDGLPAGFGLGIPGRLMDDEFIRSMWNLPGADIPMLVVIEEPTKFEELVAGDLIIRRAFWRWKDQHLELAQWRTPTLDQSVAELSDDNKAAPAGHVDNHRTATLTTTHVSRPVVKFQYSRDFSARGDKYLKSISIEDQTAVDDAGGNVKPTTVKLRNTYAQFANSGAAIEALFPDFLAFHPCVSRPVRMITRSIDLRYFEQLSIGDVVTVSDTFARDPVTGQRGFDELPAMIVAHSYDPGGKTSGTDDTRPMGGSVDLMFLDLHRPGTYAPAAQIDDTASAGGFSAGYNSGTSTIRCYEHKYSHTVTVYTYRGGSVSSEEADDASHFAAGDEILIVQIDPDDPASPVYWERVISSVSGNDIVLTAALSSPAWDATKKYRVTYQKYSQVGASQRDKAFQADDADQMIEDTEVPYNFSSTAEPESYNANSGDELAEYVPAMSYGDGRPWDPGHDRALIHTINAYIDYKSAHQAPQLWPTVSTMPLASWSPLFIGPISFGTEHLGTGVSRVLTVAPWFRSNDGSTVNLRITLTRKLPTTSPTAEMNALDEAIYADAYSQASWSTSSTTWATGADAELSLSVKDIQWGHAWLIIETDSQVCECRGLAKCIEGPRVVT